MKSILVVNPNSSEKTTAAMVAIACKFLPDVQGWTNAKAPPMITDAVSLAAAAAQIAPAQLPAARGVIVAAFGDPGVASLGKRLVCPVVGIAQAAAQAAARDGAAFAVATTTPALGASIDVLMQAHGSMGRYLGSFMTRGDPQALLADQNALDSALMAACSDAEAAGAERIIIGGGPLAEVAIRLAPQVAVPLVQPLPAACLQIAKGL